MKIDCKEVNRAICICNNSGVNIKEISFGWSEARTVVDMDSKLSVELRNKIAEQEPTLKYWNYNGSPHNVSDEGFICERCSVVISFKR